MKIDKSNHYFGAGLERLRQAWTLYQEGNSYALAMYVAGVAVECMLRAFKMRKETTFDEKHDLECLFRASGMLKIDPELLKAKGCPKNKHRPTSVGSKPPWSTSAASGPTITVIPRKPACGCI
jgi:hypothetical protein